MEQWELELRDDIFTAFLHNNKTAATELIHELVEKKSGGIFYRYRPLNRPEITALRFDQIYFCRSIRFDDSGDEWMRFKSYVACFTDRKNSLSMWSDYAHEAQGICLEYTYEDLVDFADLNGLLFSPVRYGPYVPDIDSRYSSIMSMMSKPIVHSDEYEWRLWKIDMHSSDIGKLMNSIIPRRIILGRNIDRKSPLFQELIEMTGQKQIPVTANPLSLF